MAKREQDVHDDEKAKEDSKSNERDLGDAE